MLRARGMVFLLPFLLVNHDGGRECEMNTLGWSSIHHSWDHGAGRWIPISNVNHRRLLQVGEPRLATYIPVLYSTLCIIMCYYTPYTPYSPMRMIGIAISYLIRQIWICQLSKGLTSERNTRKTVRDQGIDSLPCAVHHSSNDLTTHSAPVSVMQCQCLCLLSFPC